jgi:hypothetical protein
MSDNAINAMRAHESRAGVDSTYFRELVEGYTFATYARVTKYSNGRVDALCGSLKFTNVEVLVFGVNGWGIKPVPAVGDRVLLISSQSPIVDIKTFLASGTMPPYDVSGLKAIPVCDDLTALQLITVDKSSVKLTGANKVTVNAAGVQFEDSNGNKVSTTTSGVSFEDKNHNKVTTASSGITLEDANGNNHNKIVTSSSGVTITDANSNTIVTESKKITLTVNGGSVIEAGESSVKINNKLEIKK